MALAVNEYGAGLSGQNGSKQEKCEVDKVFLELYSPRKINGVIRSIDPLCDSSPHCFLRRDAGERNGTRVGSASVVMRDACNGKDEDDVKD